MKKKNIIRILLLILAIFSFYLVYKLETCLAHSETEFFNSKSNPNDIVYVDPYVDNHIESNTEIPSTPSLNSSNIFSSQIETPYGSSNEIHLKPPTSIPQPVYPSVWCKVNFDSKTGAVKSLTECKAPPSHLIN